MTARDRNSTVGESAESLGMPPELLEDLLLVAAVDEEPLRRISGQLSGSEGMLSPDRIKEIVDEHLDGDTSVAVSRIVANLEPHEVARVLASFDDWSRQHAGDAAVPSIATTGKLKGNLRVLVQDNPPLRLLRKARRLIREIGNELQSIMFVCDLRPVFDDEHTEVVGFIPLVNMQIGYIRQNRDREFFEATLTEDELRQVLDQVRGALNELQILNTLDGPSETADDE